jgi:hypothetical protein
MPTSVFVNNDRHLDVPNPNDWHVFEDPQQGTGPWCICIQVQKYPDYGKGDILEDKDDPDTDNNCPLSPLQATLFIQDSPTVVPLTLVPLQLISTNVQSSYVRKAKDSRCYR